MTKIIIDILEILGTELDINKMRKKYGLELYFTTWSDDDEEDLVFVHQNTKESFLINVSKNYKIIRKVEKV